MMDPVGAWASRSTARVWFVHIPRDLLAARHSPLRPEFERRAGVGLSGLELTIPGRSAGHQRVEQGGGRLGDFIDRPIERGLVGSGRSGKSTNLPDELQSRQPDFVIRRRRFEVVQRFDVSTHALCLRNRLSSQEE